MLILLLLEYHSMGVMFIMCRIPVTDLPAVMSCIKLASTPINRICPMMDIFREVRIVRLFSPDSD
jgi:hypothetical protein